MKDKIILFAIGVLVGAIIATGSFYVYTTISTKCETNTQMNGQPPSMPSGENGQMPSMPGNNTQSDSGL